MKRAKRFLIPISILLAASCLATAGAVTYAGYQRDATISQDVKVQRYLFLDVQHWNTFSPDFYIYLFNLKEVPEPSGDDYKDNAEARMWIKGTLYSGNIYWFYAPTKYEYAIFIRAKSGTPLANIQSWTKDSENIWNQTDNIDLSLGSPTKYNLFTPNGIDTQGYASGVYSLPT